MKTGGLFAAALGCALLAVAWGCVTPRGDVSGSGDERLDESSRPDRTSAPAPARGSSCGPEPEQGVLLLDARTAEPVSCVLATVLRDQVGCVAAPDQECPTEVLARGPTSRAGRLPLGGADPGRARLWAVAEGFVQSVREPAPAQKGRPAEIEMVPEDGFLLKLLDSEGNYLPGLAVVFRQGGEAIARLRTNDLSNVYFNVRTPFAGEPVVIEAEGFAPVTLQSPAELGADGNTLTLHRAR
jgi:hypothetical protein